MTQPELMQYALNFAAGLILGLFFYLGLWWTVRRLPGNSRPLLLSLLSFALRATVVLAGLWFVSGGQWNFMLAGVGGMLAARLLVVRRTGLSPEPAETVPDTPGSQAETGNHQGSQPGADVSGSAKGDERGS